MSPIGNKIIRLAYYAIVIIVCLVALISIFNSGTDMKADWGAGLGLRLSYFLVGIAILGTVGGSIVHLITHPKQGLRSLIGIGVLALVIIIGYVAGPGNLEESYAKYGVETVADSKWVDAGLIGVYVLGGMAIVGAIFSEVSQFFK